MNVLIVSGIWPPDVGGPASHGPEAAAFLAARGHRVEVVTTASAAPAEQPYPVAWVSRSLPPGLRHLKVARLIAERARSADVVYALTMLTRAGWGARRAGTPLVAKLASDPAYERARRRGLFAGDMDAFQQLGSGLRVRALRRARDRTLARAARIVCPSAYIAELAAGWGVARERIEVIPNPAPAVPELPGREELRAKLAVTGPLLVFAGRLTAQKTLEIGLEALAAARGDSAPELVVVGDGPTRGALEARAAELALGDRVRFTGALPREQALEWMRAADATLLSSSWENFPHTVVESLAVGTPVIATSVGGVAEVVEDGVNGLLVPAGDAAALADAIDRFFTEPALAARLRAAAPGSVDRYAPERVYARLEEVLVLA